VTGARIPKKPISFEIIEGTQLSDADLDSLASLVAEAIHRKLKEEETVHHKGDRRLDFTEESGIA
jgi:tRNA(Ser,Leu) C12 N-acetylase TAN1